MHQAADADVASTRQTAALKWQTLAAPIAAVGEVLGNLDKVEHFFVDLLGLTASRYLHHAMTALVAVLFIFGSAAAAKWLYLRIAPRSRHSKRVFAAAMTVALALVATAAVAFVPRPPSPDKYVREERAEWSDHLRMLSRPNGGMATSFLDAKAETQVWTTAQVVTALVLDQRTKASAFAPADVQRLMQAFDYMDRGKLRSPGGELLGWGYFEDWPTGVTEIAAWVGLAHALALHERSAASWTPAQRATLVAQAREIVELLIRSQQEDGGWGPTLDREPESYSRTYSTVMALWCLIEADRVAELTPITSTQFEQLRKAAVWLLTHYDPALGWVPNPFRPGQNERFPGLNAQVAFVLLRLQATAGLESIRTLRNFETAMTAFAGSGEVETRSIGDNARLHDSDRYIRRISSARANAVTTCMCPFTIEGSTFLWYPWTLAAAEEMAANPDLSAELRERAEAIGKALRSRLRDAKPLIDTGMSYVSAEFLAGVSLSQLSQERGRPKG
jgi:hypothetical protein